MASKRVGLETDLLRDNRIATLLSELTDETQLTKWEAEFVEHVSDKFSDGKVINSWEFNKLEEIYAKLK